MTAAMRKASRRLPSKDRYPLPPRELTERTFDTRRYGSGDLTLAAHFGFGALCGALIALGRPRPSVKEGMLEGLLVWSVSYYGWIPAMDLLKPATRHPASRNCLMAGVHLVWGGATALALRELDGAARTIFSNGPLRDATRCV